ncbi:TPA: hypothetical protein N2826_005032 [Vibrio parahaemolyticus]|uniref:hypothetical protein n=1 Tax=Vibrio parahaemolyticus TaxID=670 RepID=UPI00215D313C|nr:hypothetical protein [Vibrio parahaemolyticus]MCS0014517.1 hypothetical protein [Vibrio parahaemolyticus]HCM0880726.1 hypothetical protein [Vibrio parahaemolyticus]HCM0884485.1 hypothetical protein [Vibrio parahaemolyticus]
MNTNLRTSLAELFPEFHDILMVQHSVSNSSWQAPLYTGKLLELTSLLFVCKAFKKLGATISIPDFYYFKPELFYLRNEMPLHHSAQAGHSANLYSDIDLTDRFVAAFTPKVTIHIGDICFYMMREGNPIHELEQALKHDIEYKDRPDIGIYSGEISVTTNGKIVNVVSKSEKTEAHFALEVKNTSIIPLVDYFEEGEHSTTTHGIIECSVNKSSRLANSQIDKYIEVFKNLVDIKVSTLFINGGKDISKYPTINVDMDDLIDSFSSLEIERKLSEFIDSMR